MLLSEQGADCIKIEPKPNKKQHRSHEFALFNRSKKSLVLDLTHPEGRTSLARLVMQTDVIISDLLPKEKKTLQLGYENLCRYNNGLIYCSVTPWGEQGPLKNMPANEGVITAFAGNMVSQGGSDWPPVYVFLPMGSYAAAMLAAFGISLGLFARTVTGMGQQIDTSLLAGAITMEAGAFVFGKNLLPVKRHGQSIQQGILPAYRLYRCKDSRWIMLACGNPTFWNKTCLALDRLDLLSDPRFEDMPWTIRDPENIKSLTDILTDIFCAENSEYWLELFDKNDVPCAPVNTRCEFMQDPQANENSIFVEIDDYYLGKMKQMGIPIILAEHPASIKNPAPRWGQHTTRVLSDFGFQKREITELKKKGIIG